MLAGVVELTQAAVFLRAPTMSIVRGFEFPDAIHYLMVHDTWARLDDDGLVTVGMTSLGVHISGEFIEFVPKPIGTMVERERSLGVLEISKVIRSARAPISGVIVEGNAAVRARAMLINEEPYGRGWLVRMRPARWLEDAAMLVTGAATAAAVEAYMALLAEQFDSPRPT